MMKLAAIIAIIAAAIGILSWSAVGSESASATNGLILAYSPAVPSNLVSRVAANLQDSFPLSIETMAVDELPAELDERVVASVLEGLFATTNVPVAVIVLIPGSNAFDERTRVLADDHLAIVSVNALRVTESATSGVTPDEQLARRVEKETLTGVASVLKIDPCLMPRCGLYPVSTPDALDFKARNPCPPCQMRIESSLQP